MPTWAAKLSQVLATLRTNVFTSRNVGVKSSSGSSCLTGALHCCELTRSP